MRHRTLLHAALLTAIAAGLAAPAGADHRPHGGIFRHPDVSGTHVVFVYGNDLWTVPREGGLATPLASPPGVEAYPRFSPDGDTIAFVGEYEGTADVYTLPVTGDVPHRVTWHPTEERLCDWTPDGRELVFAMRGLDGIFRRLRLYRVPLGGGLPTKLPVPYGALGSLDATGERLAYVPQGGDHPSWKRYRGGRASDVWTFHLKDHTSRRVTDWEGADTWPMWHGERIYFLSDAGPAHRMNVWSFDLQTGTRRQVTRFADRDVRWPALGPGPKGQGEIVFQLGTGLHLLDLATEQVRPVEVTIPGARPAFLPQVVDASKFIQRWNISPTGKRAVVEARGDVWTLPAKKGSARNLTRTSGRAERSPAWSPDGRWVAYFADDTGEYELYVTRADGKGETRQLTKDSRAFLFRPVWSPDSKRIAFTDKTATLYVSDLESGERRTIDRDPLVEDEGMWGFTWSHDSRWLAYARGLEGTFFRAIFLHDLEAGTSTQVTSGRFNDENPTFDRKGDYLYFKSSRHFTPRYADFDQTWIYANTEVLLVVPLRADQASPFAPESDEEEVDEEEEAEDEENEEEKGDDETGDEDEAAPEAAEDDGLSGVWEGTATSHMLPAGGLSFTLTIALAADGSISGSLTLPVGTGEIEAGSFDRESGRLVLEISGSDGVAWRIEAEVKGDTVRGTASAADLGLDLEFEGERTAMEAEAAEGEKEKKKDGKRERVEVDLEGFEARAIRIPVEPGHIGRLAVNHAGALLYARYPMRGEDGEGAIHLFDVEADEPEEKSVATGSGEFTLSADGKQMLVVRGDSASIQKASAGGSGKPVPKVGMQVRIDPREEWRQVFTDVWRILRDFFYDPHMHGVDWPAMRDRYVQMLDDCVAREDVTYVLQEMIGELNVGHANYFARPFWRNRPAPTTGMLGVDYALENGAYRIARIHRGAAWDVDARGPLGEPGLDVEEGDYLLAVNGVPVDATKAPWAALEGLVGRPVLLTVSEHPTLDEAAREVLVVPAASEQRLRYRAWVESKRRYVDERTGGRVGYVHVPNTGRSGQNELYRQAQGQAYKPALIVDERWNGGGQLPDRFVEMLNRPVRNYWARRDGRDWHTPFAAHQGPKCMLMNGSSGSGGDAFPAYFRQSGLGKLIGTRTWGGLVGISGNPGPIDGTWVSVPTFAYYERDGTWGIEGHGVDPDIEVIDDPAVSWDGTDPQLDKAIEVMLAELETKPYVKPKRPAYPDRSGMGLPPEDR